MAKSEVVVKKAKTKAGAADGEPVKLKVSKAVSSKEPAAEAPSEKSKRKVRESPAAEGVNPDAAVEPEEAERPSKRTRGDAAKRADGAKRGAGAKAGKAEKTKAKKADEPAENESSSPEATVSGAEESGDEAAAVPLLDLAVSLHDGRKTTVRALLDAGPDETDSIGFVVYPKASTPGCTKQCKEFSDQLQTFAQLGVAVVGVSLDSVASQRSFAKNNELGLPLIADGAELLKRLNCLDEKKVIRSVVAVDRHGYIFYEKHKVSSDNSARDFIAYLQQREEPPTEKDEEPSAKPTKQKAKTVGTKPAANKPAAAARPTAVAKEKKPKDAVEKKPPKSSSKEKAPLKVK